MQATDKDWSQLQGKFLINGSPSKIIIYFEGPPAGTDILLNYLIVKHAEKVAPLPPPDIEVGDHLSMFCFFVLVQSFIVFHSRSVWTLA